jgi:hypothetical protein
MELRGQLLGIDRQQQQRNGGGASHQARPA